MPAGTPGTIGLALSAQGRVGKADNLNLADTSVTYSATSRSLEIETVGLRHVKVHFER